MLQKFFILGFILMLASCSTTKKEVVMSEKAELYYSSGTQNLLDQRYTEALQFLTKANEISPNNPKILNNLGMAYYLKGHRDLAVKTIEHALQLDDGNTDARSNLAAIAMKENDYPRAEQLLNEVLKDLVYDKQAITYYNLGIVYLKRNDPAKAKEYFMKSIAEDSSYCPSHFRLGVFSYQKRKFKEALDSFKEASMGVCYQDPSPIYYQAITLIEMGNFDEARIKLNEVDSRFPKSEYSSKARMKLMNITHLENKYNNQTYQATGSKMESPEF
jgi:type IV pilus assembly protein PilF